MSSLENIELKEIEKQVLLKDFKQMAYELKRYSVLREKFLITIKEWLSLKMTALVQKTGYNGRRIRKFNGKKIILNIGCLEVIDNRYVNGDLFPDIDQIFQILNDKTKINHELFINLCYYDSHLSGVADGIVLSHVLEHLPPVLAITALKNSLAYLKQGGGMRISVPYLGAYDQINMPQCQKVENRMLAKNRLIYDYGHQFMYDADLLTVLMEEAGFSEVKEVSFSEGVLGETDLPHRQPESIYLTGVKA